MQDWSDIVYPEDIIIPGANGEIVLENIEDLNAFDMMDVKNKKRFIDQKTYNPLLQFDYSDGKTYQIVMSYAAMKKT